MDFSNPTAIAKLLIPKVPFLLKTATFHTLSLSSTSSKWDLRTEITVNLIRSILSGPPEPVSKAQKISLRAPAVKGNKWISRVTIPSPVEDDIRQALFNSIDDLKTGNESYTKPDVVPVEAEWTGFRSNVAGDAAEPSISEAEKYKNLMEEVKSDVTILYLHGGAYYLMDPATHRFVTSKLAELTGGRVLNVRYRLAPQHPFPSALLDAFLSYLYLLYPPAGSSHEPVLASNIVFAGDSAGGNLATVLLQLLLQLHRSSSDIEKPTVMFHGQKVEVPLPGGIALASPWMDISRCMPSLQSNAKYDYLPLPQDGEAHNFPPCGAWPANPPRADLYCDGSALCHPLVSPLAAMDWKGAPPVYMNCGEEMLADEAKVVARRMGEQGVKVQFDEYEAMPHVFPVLFEGTPVSNAALHEWAEFIKTAVESPANIEAKAEIVTARKLDRKLADLATLISMPDNEVLSRMQAAKERRITAFEATSDQPPVSKL